MSTQRKFYDRPYIKNVKDQIRLQFSNTVKLANIINFGMTCTFLPLYISEWGLFKIWQLARN